MMFGLEKQLDLIQRNQVPDTNVVVEKLECIANNNVAKFYIYV